MAQRVSIAVGVSAASDTQRAAGACAEAAVRNMGRGRVPGWALAFCGGRHDPEAFLSTLHRALGGIPIVGGSAVGCITNTTLGYTGFECAVMTFPDTMPPPRVLTETGLDEDEREAGRRLGERLQAQGADGSPTLLFYDSVRDPGPPPALHVGSVLLEGLYAGLGDCRPAVVGGGTLGDFNFGDACVFDGQTARRHAVTAVVLPGFFRMRTAIMHGCLPVSGFHEITRIDGATVYELDGRPALEVLCAGGLPTQALTLDVTLGRKHGDPFAPDDEARFVNRLILGTDPQAGSITLFEADFAPGERVQVMSRENGLMLESARKNAEQLLEEAAGEQLLFGLYVDCAGRSAGFCGADGEEAAEVQAALEGRVPLIGFYSGVEIGEVMGRARPLDWTGVLALFTWKDGHDGLV